MNTSTAFLLGIALLAGCAREPDLPSLEVDLSKAQVPGTQVPGYRLRPVPVPSPEDAGEEVAVRLLNYRLSSEANPIERVLICHELGFEVGQEVLLWLTRTPHILYPKDRWKLHSCRFSVAIVPVFPVFQ